MRFAKPEGSLMVKILRNTVLILFLVIFISIVVNFRNKESDTECALMAEVTSSTEFKGVFIRSERPVTYNGNGVLSYNVADGGKLGKGTVIAEVYPSDEQIGRNREIEKLTRELALLEKIQNPGTLESAKPSGVSANIEENYRSFIYCRDMYKYEDIDSVAESLLVQMSTYQIISEELTNFDKQINDIKARILQLKQASVRSTQTIKSDASAYFVSYCDGYEETLNTRNLTSLKAEQLKSVRERRIESDAVVGKLIDGYNWYVAGIVDNSRKEYDVGDTVKLRFESSADLFDAEIFSVTDSGDPKESVIVLTGSKFNHALVQHRTETVELIKGNFKGLKIPRNAIRFASVTEKNEDGSEASVTCKGVYVRKGEKDEFKKLDVIYEGSDYVLSAVHERDPEYVALYDDIITDHD